MSENPRGFGSDNFSGVHPEVLEAIARANRGHVPAYGEDFHTAAAERCFRDHFGDDAQAFLVFNGTGANVLAVDAVTRPHQAVVCPATAHMNVDECGAPERLAGVKLIPVETPDGKLTPALVEARLDRLGDQHAVQPRLVSISQATELGTLYTLDEVRALAAAAHEWGLLLHVDGARLANAAVALDLSLGALTTEAGVDVLSFGGTKNGLLVGDAVVFLRPELIEGFAFTRKQLGQLASKMRFLAVQFEVLLGTDLWRRNAAHANEMAGLLAERIASLPGVHLVHAVQSNAVFASLPAEAIARLRAGLPGEVPFHVWDERTGTVRLMCSWDTEPDEVERLAGALAGAAALH